MTPNYYPNYQSNYQPNYPQYQQPMQYQYTPPTQNQILAWVKDEKEAIDFPLSAGQSIFLMSQNEPYLYAKSIDQLGKPTFIKKRLVDEGGNDKPNLAEYIRREEIEDIITDRIQKEVEKRMSEISFKPTKSRKPVIIDEE